MTSRPSAVTETPLPPSSNPSVQLVQADVAKATQPGLFDNLPDSAFTVDHNLLIDARPADRMLLCLALDVSASAVKVAVALAYHGWTSWPSRETLCRLTNLKSPHVTRATNELEKAGVIARRRRYHTGGNVGIQYTFNGLALAEATVDQEHPTLQSAITNLVTAPENGQEQRSTAITNLVTAEEEDQEARDSAVTNLVTAEPGIPRRDYRIGNRAVTNLVPEPEDRTGRVTLIDDHQSISGSSGSISPDARNFAAADELPDWYQQLERQLDAAIVPDFNMLQEAAMLAGWTDQVMAAAARLYARNYRNQRVNNAGALFRKLAIQEASKVAVPPKQARPSYSDERRSRR